MFKSLSLSLALLLVTAASPVLAADATPSQVYEAARAGRLNEAQQMINQVLRDHPQSGEAHYVAAQVNARMGNLALARQQLAEARRLDPTLPFASQGSVQALERQLAGNGLAGPQGFAREAPRRGFPWGWLLLLFGGLAMLWRFLQRRQQQTVYRNYPGGYQNTNLRGGAPGPGGPSNPGSMPQGGVMPGTGSGMLGGLATGLAAGAGLAAGEEVIHRVTGSGEHQGAVPPAGADELNQGDNANMGGNDFGLNDDSSSWDDGSGGGGGDFGGGGDDWT